jgi:hypothetical protein
MPGPDLREALAVARAPDAAAFLETAGPCLAEREAEHNLIFGICANLLADPGFPSGQPLLLTVHHAGEVVAAAVMTPPWNLVLSCADDPDAWRALAADLHGTGVTIPGVTGPVRSAASFADAWRDTRGATSTRTIGERIYRLKRVVPPSGVQGAMRVAGERDRELLVAWVDAFMEEALNRATPEAARVLVDRSFRAGTRTWYLWEDGGEPVSVAAAGGPTPNGIRIGPVYTPPDRRGHGYASAVTAAASQAQLDLGRRFVFLFTDLANPTSNKIYQQIGYEPVIDVDQLAFSESAGPR